VIQQYLRPKEEAPSFSSRSADEAEEQVVEEESEAEEPAEEPAEGGEPPRE